MTLHRLPCLDSAALVAARPRELEMPQAHAAWLGRTAVDAARAEYYEDASGRRVDWRRSVAAAVAARESIPPDAPLPAAPADDVATTRAQVANETTLGAARRLVDAGLRPLVLNLANGA